MNKNNKSLISIIIPTYNAADYLDNCIKSAIGQSYKTLEIIVVNDGSTDDSATIAEKWSQLDSRIHIIHKKNEGVTIARKTGVLNASGEWILFMDSDDTMPVDAVEILTSHIKDDIDMIYGCVNIIGNKQPIYSNFGELNTIKYIKLLLRKREYWAPFARLIRKSTFDKFTFAISPKIIIGEDFIMNIRLSQNFRKVILLQETVYNYVWRPQSAMSKLSTLDKYHRKLFIETFSESFNLKFKKALKYDIIYFKLKRHYRMLKTKIKNILKWIK